MPAEEIVVADVAYGCAGRGVNVESGIAAELADSEEVSAIGNNNDVAEIVLAGDGGEAMDLLLGIERAGLDDDVAERNSVGQQVVTTDAAFRVAGVLIAAAAKSDDERGDLLAIKIDGVVEAEVKRR